MRKITDKRLKSVRARYDKLVSGLPEPMKGLALELSALLSHGCASPAEYYGAEEFYPLLRFPLWIEDKYIKDGALTGREGYAAEAAAAALFGYLYIRIQDNVLDEPDQFDSAFLLLGNEYVREFFSTYHRLFPPESHFWEYFREYWLGTSNNTLWERRRCRGRLMELCDDDLPALLPRIGGKLDGAKVSVAAVCLLAGREGDIPRYCRVLDRLNIASQLHNDAVSFVKDLKHDYFTCVIADTLGNGETEPARDELFARASLKALTGTHLEDWLEFAQIYNRDALAVIGKDELPGLGNYVLAKNAHLKALREEIVSIKKEMLAL